MTQYSVNTLDNVCELGGVINFDSAPALLQLVAENFQPNQHLTLDFSAVTSANSAALALLLEWKELAAQQSCTLNHQNLPDSIQQLSQICQVSEFI